MKTSNIIFTSVAALALLASPIVLADHHGDKGGKGSKMFEKHDTDGDGKVSAAEHAVHAQERFAKMDADGDGYVTKEEFKAAKGKMRHKMKEKKAELENNSVE